MPSVHGGAIVASVIPPAPLGTDAAASPSGLGAATAQTPLGATAERRFRFELAAHPGSPAQARHLTRARLTGWSVCEDTCDSAELVVSELVTNAIVHTASTHIVCELLDDDDLVRIAVRDEGCAPGQPHAASRTRPEEEHGRGLLLVDALCHSWGAHEDGPGLLVWAELPRTADATDAPESMNAMDALNVTDPLDVTEAPGTADGPSGPRSDLGWGARPKRGPSDDSDDGDEPPRAHLERRAPEAHHQRRAPEVPPQGRRRERRHP
ncbi:ATP-binding protein [Streptomyces sp. NPDC007984]|uniref:ATP-binding protein n=1 Tax=Streptomyces sp. NPDC007984 TaxID=3364801 RepID=UPI0036E3C0D6